ncbi:pentapeptide repeat-containing protein [Aquimarina sp. RZ0]|uniref:pentapeptide repeat-containing protein n=1 Tax=Aquimarina sp. RZ0 TaxID=2607730 RepID=UPI0011F22E87|nr:pentapeptide repeat-containing protein [Aquimarina sp. RZ0]KAA1245838.1 hypothetical protein F0000_10610 [Aquimarina sp. RZ0]
MEERIAENIDQLIKFWKDDIKVEIISIPEEGIYEFDDNEDGFKNIIIDFELFIPFDEDAFNDMQNHLRRNVDPYKFKGCAFKKEVRIHNRSEHYVIAQNCSFEKELKIRMQKSNLTLLNCSINTLNFENAIFGIDGDNDNNGKCRLKSCKIENTNFRNTTFYGLVDFYNSTFIKPVNFYKTDFLNIVVFSATNFTSNVLFTYSLLGNKTIFRGTKFDHGLDLSLAIIKGDLLIFNISLDDRKYKSLNKKLSETEYEKSVSIENTIPILNKRETYRIIKRLHENNNNIVASIPFKVNEKKTLFKESWTKLWRFEKVSISFSNIWVLGWNAISNKFGSSYIIGALFTIVIGFVFFYLSIIQSSLFEYSNSVDWESFTKGFKYYIQFLIPTHKFNYLGENVNLNWLFYMWDFTGRLFVGYGIYQTIQAFRKYR